MKTMLVTRVYMNRTKKLWFVVEGHAEIFFIKNLIRKEFPDLIYGECGSKEEFRSHIGPAFYIQNSCSVDRVPHDLVEYYHLIKRSSTEAVIIVCDVEKALQCPSKRKEKIISLIENNQKEDEPVEHGGFIYVFSIPSIESIYGYEKETTEKVIRVLGKSTGFKTDKLELTAQFDKDKMKKLCQQNGFVYREKEFAERFFAQLEYSKSSHHAVRRLYSRVNEILS